jgi:hypothetical protein
MVKYAFTDPFLSVITFGLIIHKSPLVYYECEYVYNDISYFDNTIIPTLQSTFTGVTLWSHILECLMFNLGDVFFDMQLGFKYIEFRDYYSFGTMIGYIVSDLFYINPTSFPVWANQNSHVILSDTSSLKVPSSFYQPIV